MLCLISNTKGGIPVSQARSRRAAVSATGSSFPCRPVRRASWPRVHAGSGQQASSELFTGGPASLTCLAVQLLGRVSGRAPTPDVKSLKMTESSPPLLLGAAVMASQPVRCRHPLQWRRHRSKEQGPCLNGRLLDSSQASLRSDLRRKRIKLLPASTPCSGTIKRETWRRP